VGGRSTGETLVNRIDPQAAFVDHHDIHVAMNVDPVALVIDPRLDEIVLSLQDRVQRIQQVQTGVAGAGSGATATDLLLCTRTLGVLHYNIELKCRLAQILPARLKIQAGYT